MPPNADQADHDNLMTRLLCDALDGADTDPTRLSLMTRLFLLTPDADRDHDLARLRQSGPSVVVAL
ncbi:hypothetical protein EBB05_18440 [Methylobacterium brachiatum]|nr:hypothetical protein EBB05_18440 [Methylobacterium brachiatum]